MATRFAVAWTSHRTLSTSGSWAAGLHEDAGTREPLAEVGRDVTPVNIPPLLASAYPGRTYFELEWLAKHTLAPGAGDCFAALAMTVSGKLQ
jgi:hypothetical protein